MQELIVKKLSIHLKPDREDNLSLTLRETLWYACLL